MEAPQPVVKVTPQPVVDMASRLAEAMNTTLNPQVSHAVRLEAYNMLEQAKEDLEVAVECGFFMAHKDKAPVVRHLGLQLLEHAIKYKWNDLSVEQKVYIKENVMQLFAEGTLDLLSEHIFVKDKVSRLVVEMIKREWPQQWPGLLTELHELSKRGPTQTELVLLVFLRIAEDVATLQNLESNQRRRDLYQALAANMEKIFEFFLTLLEENFRLYEVNVKQDSKGIAQQHCRVLQVVLMTLAVFVEWVSVQHVFSQDAKLLKSLCIFLEHDSLKMEAAECLLQIVSRKGKPDERRPVLLLFYKEPMSAIFEAAIRAVNGQLGEDNYRFLKTLTQVLTMLGSQLCGLWGKEPGVLEPVNFNIYLKVMLTFTNHPSLIIYNYANNLWNQMFRHEHVVESEAFKFIIPAWIESVTRKVMKHGYPSKNDSESCQYSRFDFDSDEDYSQFFYKVRSESLDVIKVASSIASVTMFKYVEDLLVRQLQKPLDAEKQLCNLYSPFFLEWEALAQIVESVMVRTMQSERDKPDADSGVKLLQQCIIYETVDPLVLSALLSCISGLFVFVKVAPGMLMDVLNKIFSALTFSLPGQTKDSRSRAVRNVRRHGCSLLVKIARSYPDILINAFDFLSGVAENLSHDPLELSQLEKVTVNEALILISNQFFNFEKQSDFIGKLVKSSSEFWLSVRQQFSSPLEFMSFVGLDKAPVEPSENDVNGQNRAQIVFCVNHIAAIIKRSEFPSDADQAERGGFVLQKTENGTVCCRSPATPHILPLLPQLFCLARLFNTLWHPDALTRVSNGYAKAHNLPESEKNNILGLNSVNPTDPYCDLPKVQHPLERMQYFLSMVHDHIYHILGNAGISLGLEFYRYPHLSEYLIHSSFSNLHLIPDYRIRPIIRTFLKPFIQSCPVESYKTVLLPLLSHVCPYMLERLSGRWDNLTAIIDSGAHEEENRDAQEILEDLLIRMLTREYVDLLKAVLVGGQRGAVIDAPDVMEADGDIPAGPTGNTDTLSELGELVLGSDVLCQSVVTTLLKILWWQDSVACLKSAWIVGIVLRWLSNEGQLLSAQAVNQVLMSVLQGLQRHGQHDGNQSALLTLGLAVYEMFLPHFPSIRGVILEIPGVTEDNIQKFEERICSVNQNVKSVRGEKNKKESFKKLINEIIGRNVGQALKKEVHIKNLPPIFKTPRPKQPSIEEIDTDIGLNALFGSESNGICDASKKDSMLIS